MKDAVVINLPVQRVVCTGCGAEANASQLRRILRAQKVRIAESYQS
jgi:hypothetical protein